MARADQQGWRLSSLHTSFAASVRGSHVLGVELGLHPPHAGGGVDSRLNGPDELDHDRCDASLGGGGMPGGMVNNESMHQRPVGGEDYARSESSTSIS